MSKWFEGVAVLLVSFGVLQLRRCCSNHRAQRPASVHVAGPENAMWQFKIKSNLYSVQQVWLSLHWLLWQGCAGGLWVLRFCWSLEVCS